MSQHPEDESNADESAVEQTDQDLVVVDDTETDDLIAPTKYDITSFGADYDAEGLVKRLQRDDIFIPPFQRAYVWNIKEASRFVESLLLGLPVPGIFLARDFDSKRLLVIDGQQRLKTLQFYFEGLFAPDPDATTQRIFKLQGVQPEYEGRTYEMLAEADRILLNDAIIHATIVKQESPVQDQSSVYHIFERLNTSGRKLSPHQIRVAIYHSDFIELIRELNDGARWRAVFGRKSKSLKDQELILRFLALFYDRSSYTRPMKDFLNQFTHKAIRTGIPNPEACRKLFESTIHQVHEVLGSRAFRPERALNAAVFDSVMVGLATRLESGSVPPPTSISAAYDRLLQNEQYLGLVSRATADDKSVRDRIDLCVEEFGQDVDE